MELSIVLVKFERDAIINDDDHTVGKSLIGEII